jgi:anti-anti-sigma factor
MTSSHSWGDIIPFHGERIEILPEEPRDAHPGVVYLRGRLTTENSPEVLTHLRNALNSTSLPDTVILDLRGLRYASSTGIGVIANLLVDLQNRSIVLELANVAENVREVFDLLGFSQFFHFIERG